MTTDSTTPPRKPLSLALKSAIAAAAILAILGVKLAATLVMGNVTSVHAEARTQMARMHVREIHGSVRLYQMTKGKLPDDLRVLAERDVKGESLLTELPQDPWGHDFVLDVESPTSWRVISIGPDGAKGTEDDISSAERER